MKGERVSSEELRKRLDVARLVPGVAHLPAFGLVGPSPTCSECGDKRAPIIDGKHLPGWCLLTCENCGENYRERDHVIVDVDPGLCLGCAVGG